MSRRKLEAKITQQTRDYLRQIRLDHKPHVFFYKVADKFTSGLPDWYILIKGQALHIEQKAEGEVARGIQIYVMKRLYGAGAITLTTDSFEETKAVIQGVLLDRGISMIHPRT